MSLFKKKTKEPEVVRPVEYKIVSSYSRSDLVKDINKMIDDGWHCQGGVVHFPGGASQAMVRENDTEPKLLVEHELHDV